MTLKVWSWRGAIKLADLKPLTKLVLFNLSTHMSDVGDTCYPSTKTQAKDTGLSERSVITHLNLAVEAGFLVKQVHGYAGRKWKRNEYLATIPQHWTNIDVCGQHRTNEALNEVHHLNEQGTEPDDIKALNEVQSNSSYKHSNIKKKKREKKEKPSLPDCIPEDTFADFLEERKRQNKGKALSQVAITRLANRLEKMWHEGEDIEAVLDQSIRNGWKDVYKLKQENKNNGQAKATKYDNALESRERWARAKANERRDESDNPFHDILGC